MRFYKCEICGNFVAMIYDSGINPKCCEQFMTEVVENTQEDVATEKHIPVIEVKENSVKVTVGEVIHPMIPTHFIEWIIVSTTEGNKRKVLTPADAPVAEFALLPGEKVLEAYAYCNLHGLWKKTL
ncbi:MAG: desulfoferrodoxin family protein [Bacilli bacterium]|jgi:superoxide reductase